MRLGLESTRSLLAHLGEPQAGLPGVLVAGTNGKGSVCALVGEMARRGGVRVALLTKPHLTSYRERIRLDGDPIDESFFVEIAQAVCDAADRMGSEGGRPTHHELLTAMGFLAARRWAAELVVCEVGLGGRLDATNVWDGGVAVITSISLDHQAQLGDTIPQIAREKAAIIKRGNLVVSGVPPEAQPEVEAASLAKGSRLWQLGREISIEVTRDTPQRFRVTTPDRTRDGLELGLQGSFQLANAALAVAAIDCLGQLRFRVPDDAVRGGLADVHWAGRMETLGSPPWCLVDAAHNPGAVQAALPEIRARLAGRPGVLLFGSMEDHDHQAMLRALATVDFQRTVFTRSKSARAAPTGTVAKSWAGPYEEVEPVATALLRARELAGPDGLVVALGSIYLIGEVMASLGAGVAPDPEVPFPPLW
jgi:dihydrofolate synthase/folylpolyglutamate synthase